VHSYNSNGIPTIKSQVTFREDHIVTFSNSIFSELHIKESIASYLEEREIPNTIPFYTNFDQGVGNKLFIQGEVPHNIFVTASLSILLALQLVRNEKWSQLSRQSLQPTYRVGQRLLFYIDPHFKWT